MLVNKNYYAIIALVTFFVFDWVSWCPIFVECNSFAKTKYTGLDLLIAIYRLNMC